jgi:F-type H+-transporting ATPase subunit b
MLNLDPGMMIWAWVTFLVLLFLLYKVAWKPIFSTIEKREHTIQDSLDQASKANEEAQVLLKKHEEMIHSAQSEAQHIIKENRELAEKSRQEIIEQARNSAQKMVDKAKLEIEKEKESALLALRGEVADLAIEATKKILQESLDENRQRSIVNALIDKIPKSSTN